MKKVFFLLATLFLVTISCSSFANHSKGLHLQLPDKTVDILPKDIEEAQLFKVNQNQTGIMLRLSSNAGAKLTTLTQSLIGVDVYWIWNGRVLSVQKLHEPLSTDVNIFNLTDEEAEAMAKLGHGA